MVRQSELEAARRGALTKLKNTGRVQAQILARFHHLDPSNDRFGIISVDGGPQMRVPVAPGKYVPDTIVVVLIDAAGKPVQVLAPRTDRPDGADEGLVFGAETAWKAIAPRELTPEEAQAIQDTADGLAEAQSDLADMTEYAGEEFSRLDTALDGLAAGVNGVTYSTEPPTVDGRNESDTWFQMDGDGTAGFWRWNGTEWQPTEFEDTVLGDVTLGKLRAGNVIVDEGVIGKLWADGIAARSATFSRATITARNMIPGIETLATYGGISAEDRDILPLQEFGVSTVHPSIWLQGKKSGWIHAQIPVRAGERYRFSVDVQGSVPGTMFFVQTRRANADGSMDESFSGWTDWQGPGAGSHPMNSVTVPGTGWNSYASEATATHDAVISLYVYANHENGAPNSEGYQWFRNLRMEAMQDGTLWVDGVVNARHLNIVPEQGAGGLEALPPGIRIIPPDGEAGTAISLRIDEPNWFAFAQAGRNTFSVSPDGHLVAQQVHANESLKYMGVELSDTLAEFPRGNLGRAEMSGAPPSAGYGASEAVRVVMCTIRTPPDNRLIRMTVSIQPHAGNPRRGTINLRQSTGNSVKVTNSSKQRWDFVTDSREALEYSKTATVDELGWPYNETITIGVFVESSRAGENIPFEATSGQYLSIDDVGLPTPLQLRYASGGGGSGSDSDTGKREDDDKFYPASTRSYRGDGSHYNWNEAMLFHGYNMAANGQLRSLAVFNRTNIDSLVSGSGTDMVSGYIKLFNAHTWSSQGMTVRVGYSNHTSVPSTWNGVSGDWTWIGNYTVDRGGVITVPLTSTHLARIKSGAFNAVGLVSNSNAGTQYGYFDAAKTELFVKVRK